MALNFQLVMIHAFGMFGVLPLSICYDLFLFLFNKFAFLWRRRSNISHETKVRKIQKQVHEWVQSGSKSPMCTARPNFKSITLQKLEYKKICTRIEIDLPDILELDEVNQTIRVEPMVTIGGLSSYLFSKGWTLPVVPELDDLTIGGLVMGGGVETTSHKYGLFQYICKKYEMIVADGSLVTASEDENIELYSAVPFSYGTLGFLTSVELKIVPFKPYIKLQYKPVHSLEEAVKIFEEETLDQNIDSVEGLMFSLNEGVIMSGKFVDYCDDSRNLNRIGRWYKPWFYTHVRSITQPTFEFIPSRDFYHRHNKPCFWLLENMFSFVNISIFRYLLGWALPPKHSLVKWLKTNCCPKGFMKNFYCQDLGVHIKDLKECLEYADEELGIYPIWLCPLKHPNPKHLEDLALFKMEGLHIDIGLYGFCTKPQFDKIGTQVKIERFLIERKGHVALYAETQLTQETFDEMFGENFKTYERVRKDLKCEKAFPHIFDKISYKGRGSI